MAERHGQILEEMKESGFTSPELGKELSTLSAVASLQGERVALDEDEASYKDLLQEAADTNDKELEQECRAELERIVNDRAALEMRIIDAVLPEDADDFDSDAIIEVRAGTGGDEASLFAQELLDSYIYTARDLRWKTETLSESKTELGGIRESSVLISGRPTMSPPGAPPGAPLLGPYGAFKFESGVHRVQRVPINDNKIQTSACSIAVLPSLPQDDDNNKELLPKSELKIETMRSSGAGGQHVNTTDSAVRITHLPTGITASIQDERCQRRNMEKALRLVTARVRDQERAAAEEERGATRSSLLGGGGRSERIRTFNYPQDRVTDHRCKESRHGIAALLQGGKESGLAVTFLPYLKTLRREEQLQQLEEEQEEDTIRRKAS
jgi:peptide chain release factor 1